ncbi:threonine synthase [uncultured Eubacterium sp.]|nr:threonine synthase [uncultured Eubacterium sp.]
MKKDDAKNSQKRDVSENFEAQFKKATLTLMVLKILSEREMYAYEIGQVALQRSNDRYKMPLLYTTINKLQEQGFVTESNKVISEDNRVRIYYRITDEGLTHLEKLKQLYAELDQVIWSVVYGKELHTPLGTMLSDGGNDEQD